MPHPRLRAVTVAATLILSAAASAAVPLADADFLVQTHGAMDRMMVGMDVHASGNTDVDFATMMIPHHQGAIDMAVAELRYGRDERLRRIAQEIIVDQQQEIVAMQLALRQHDVSPKGAMTMDHMNHGATQ